jgi:hypothetical protein
MAGTANKVGATNESGLAVRGVQSFWIFLEEAEACAVDIFLWMLLEKIIRGLEGNEYDSE